MDLGVYFKSTRASTKLSLSTIKNWNSTKTTLPIDLHYDVRNFTKLHGRPAIVIRRQSKGASVEDSVSNYNYNNPIDRDNYCADVEDCISPYCDQTVGYDMTKIFSQTIVDSTSLNGDITQLGSSGDLLDNLVAAPNKVAKINIGYARQAKRIDMKKLKSVMWSMLADFPSPNKENEKGLENHAQPVEDSEDKMDLEQSVEFSQLYRILPSRLSAKMSENLSVSLAFIALLHLANERNLKLTSEGELRDFIVSQG
ncbi:hypothetical protein SK128_026757 [Halocaridina rubra]|uniref:Condensin complex subunit 2 n=1 Tax=Halocaridina rubra TaxID=373956 RepID=A0AAN8WTU5_HALRR